MVEGAGDLRALVGQDGVAEPLAPLVHVVRYRWPHLLMSTDRRRSNHGLGVDLHEEWVSSTTLQIQQVSRSC